MPTERGGDWFLNETQDKNYLLKYYNYIEFYIPLQGNTN